MKIVPIALLLLVGVCSSQAFINWAVRKLDGLFGKVATVVDTLDQNLENVRSRVENLSGDVTNFVDKTYAGIREHAQERIATWRERASQARDLALNLGLDVRACAVPENTLEAIADTMIGETRSCLSQHKSSADNVQTEALELIDLADELLEAVEQSLRKCDERGQSDSVSCLAEQLNPHVKDAMLFINKTSDASKRLAELLKVASAEIASCSSSSVAQNGAAAAKLLTDAVVCVQSKIAG